MAIWIVDTSTGKTTPGRVAIVSFEDDSLRLPPDGGRYEGGGSVIADFYRGIEFDPDPNWIEPVRKVHGRGDNKHRRFVYGHKDSLPYWKELFSDRKNKPRIR